MGKWILFLDQRGGHRPPERWPSFLNPFSPFVSPSQFINNKILLLIISLVLIRGLWRTLEFFGTTMILQNLYVRCFGGRLLWGIGIGSITSEMGVVLVRISCELVYGWILSNIFVFSNSYRLYMFTISDLLCKWFHTKWWKMTFNEALWHDRALG